MADNPFSKRLSAGAANYAENEHPDTPILGFPSNARAFPTPIRRAVVNGPEYSPANAYAPADTGGGQQPDNDAYSAMKWAAIVAQLKRMFVKSP